jgi:hypothetical protein
MGSQRASGETGNASCRFFFAKKAWKGEFTMDQQVISLMIALFVFLNIPILFLYRWERKRPSRLRWRVYARCFLVVCGSAFTAAFLLANIVDSTSSALAYAFQLDRETSAEAAKMVVKLMAAVLSASLSALYIARKITQSGLTDHGNDTTRLLSRTKFRLVKSLGPQ